MTVDKTLNGVTYHVPEFNDTGWAQGQGNLTQLLEALVDAVNGNANLFINGDFQIDQRNEGAAIIIANNTNTYGPDMWFGFNRGKSGFFSLQQKTTTPPTGFLNYIRITITTADATPPHDAEYVLSSRIEGNNCKQLLFGTSNAVDLTLSFWARSSIAGTYGVTLESGSSDSYPMSYTINTANTWQFFTLNIPGDTAGTWNTGFGIGMKLIFDLGSGTDFQASSTGWTTASEKNHFSGSTQIIKTLAATIDFGGVQLQVGDTASGFVFLTYDQSLRRCMRYYEKSYAPGVVPGTSTTTNEVSRPFAQTGASETQSYLTFLVPKFTTPTMTFYTDAGVSGKWTFFTSGGSGTDRTLSTTIQGSNGVGIFQSASTELFAKGHYEAVASIA